MPEERKSLVQVFGNQMVGIAHLMRNIAPGWKGFNLTEPGMGFDVTASDAGPTLTLWRQRVHGHQHQAVMEFRNITPAGIQGLAYGPERALKSDALPGVSETLDNRDGTDPLDWDLSEEATDAIEKANASSKSVGGSVSVTLEAKESVEGMAEFGESVTAEVHSDLEESQSETISSGTAQGAAFKGTIAAGQCRVARLRQSREDIAQEVEATGKMTFAVAIGLYNHGGHARYKWDQVAVFPSLQELDDIVLHPNQQADNAPLVQEARAAPVRHADLWALDLMPDSKVHYTATYQGVLKRRLALDPC